MMSPWLTAAILPPGHACSMRPVDGFAHQFAARYPGVLPGRIEGAPHWIGVQLRQGPSGPGTEVQLIETGVDQHRQAQLAPQDLGSFGRPLERPTIEGLEPTARCGVACAHAGQPPGEGAGLIPAGGVQVYARGTPDDGSPDVVAGRVADQQNRQHCLFSVTHGHCAQA